MSKISKNREEVKQDDQLIMKIPYFQVPNWIFDQAENLTEHEKITLIYLCRCGNQGATAFPSLPTIGQKCGFSRRTAATAIKGLIDKGYLIKHNRTGTSNIYEVVSQGHGVVQEVHGGVVQEMHPKKNYSFKEELLRESTTQPEKEPARSHSFLNDEKQKTVFKESLSLYCELYKQQLDIKPALNKGKDHKLIKQLLSEYGAEAVQFAIKEHLTNPDEWTRRGGCTIPQLKHNFPGYLLKYKKHQEEAEREQREREAKRLRIEQMRQEEEKERQEKLRRAALTPEQRKLEDMETSMNLLKAKIEMRETLVEMKNGDNEQITKLREHQNQLQQLENEYNELVQAVAV
jgi:hypothetical protein